jgi:dTDP-4-amino-4,6-dideoxygalactose transaminase
MAAILLNIKTGDEIIMPSYTFVSTANAFVLRGAKIVFVDIRPDTMNIDESKIEEAITGRTKVIVPVHYAGVSCEMDKIMDIANKHNLFVVEDAAQGMMCTYKKRPLGTIGHLGTYSFHESKNYTSAGEGGLLIIHDDTFIDRAEIIREKGTNRSQFFLGMVDKYSWVDMGSSYLMNDVSAAYLWGNLEAVDEINSYRLSCWESYWEQLKPLEDSGHLNLPIIPESCSHNAHMFYVKLKDMSVRSKLIQYLKERDISSAFHYIPLHSAEIATRYSRFNSNDEYTSLESERLLRLPMFFGLKSKDIEIICKTINDFFTK